MNHQHYKIDVKTETVNSGEVVYVATTDLHDGAIGQGDTPDEAIQEMFVSLTIIKDHYIEHGLSFPGTRTEQK